MGEEVVADLAMSSTAIASDQEPPSKKLATEPTSNLPLPYDLVVNCLARVSILHYPILSLVSKSFQSIIASSELYQTRTLLRRTESCLYVCLRFPHEPNPRWFTLYQKPDKTLNNHISKRKKKKTKKKESSSGYVLAPLPIINSPPLERKNLAAVGHKLCVISGGATKDADATCSDVFFLDCQTHAWLEAPSVRLSHTTNCEFDGKMDLAGSSENPDASKCVEVFDTKTQTWNPVPSRKRMLKFRIVEGKIYMNSDAVGLDRNVHRGEACLIDKVIYSYSKSSGKFHWGVDGYNLLGRVEGLEGLPKFANYSTVRLADFGGKMVVLWDKYVPASRYKEKMIWCAVISLEKRGSEEIWGKVEWFDAVLTVPKSYKFLNVIAATV